MKNKSSIIKNAKRFKAKLDLKNKLKSIPGKVKQIPGKIKAIPGELRALVKRKKELKKKIDNGTATLKDKMDYRTTKAQIREMRIQIGISAAQLAAMAGAGIATAATGGAALGIGIGASKIGAGLTAAQIGGGITAGLSATGNTSLAKAALISGTEKGNKKIIKKLKKGEKLNLLDKYKVKQAKKIK